MNAIPNDGIRPCGGSDDDRCSACCYSHAVRQVPKKELSTCPSQNLTGCNIYELRPKACQLFFCAWAKRIIGTDDERPDKVGLVFSKPLTWSKDEPPILFAGEAWPGALRKQAAQNFLTKVLQRGYVVQMRSRETNPRSQWHIFRRSDRETFGRKLEAEGESIVWHEHYVPITS